MYNKQELKELRRLKSNARHTNFICGAILKDKKKLCDSGIPLESFTLAYKMLSRKYAFYEKLNYQAMANLSDFKIGILDKDIHQLIEVTA